MAVALDATSESHSGTTGSASEASFSWTHTPSGTPAGILVFVCRAGGAAISPSVTWGGVTIPEVTGGYAVDAAGEQGATTAFFLGSGLSSRANDTITVTRTNSTDIGYGVAATVTAGADTAVYTAGIVLLEGDAALAEQSVNDGSPGTNSLRFAGVYSGLNLAPTAGANSTLGPVIDLGGNWCGLAYETTAGQGSRSVGMSSGTSDDIAAVHLAVYETGGGGGGAAGPLIGGKLVGRSALLGRLA